MEFNINHPILYILAGICITVVILQSVVFLRKALKRAKELGISDQKLKEIKKSAIVFTIAPAIAVGIGILTLAPILGIPLPWIRLSVVGAITYELSAAEAATDAVKAVLGSGLTAQQFVTIAWTMTAGIAIGIFLIPIFCKKTVTGLSSAGFKDKKWAEHFSNALFFGFIAIFVANGVSGVTVSGSGLVKAIVLVVSALIMCLCGILKGKFKWKWINDYALPICMVLSMALAIPLSMWIGA